MVDNELPNRNRNIWYIFVFDMVFSMYFLYSICIQYLYIYKKYQILYQWIIIVHQVIVADGPTTFEVKRSQSAIFQEIHTLIHRKIRTLLNSWFVAHRLQKERCGSFKLAYHYRSLGRPGWTHKIWGQTQSIGHIPKDFLINTHEKLRFC